MAGQDPDENETTLVQSGRAAVTFTEMAAFVRDIEARPLARLLADLGGLMALPDAKYSLVVMVLGRRAHAGGAEGRSIVAAVRRLQAGAADLVVRRRAEALLPKLQG